MCGRGQRIKWTQPASNPPRYMCVMYIYTSHTCMHVFTYCLLRCLGRGVQYWDIQYIQLVGTGGLWCWCVLALLDDESLKVEEFHAGEWGWGRELSLLIEVPLAIFLMCRSSAPEGDTHNYGFYYEW